MDAVEVVNGIPSLRRKSVTRPPEKVTATTPVMKPPVGCNSSSLQARMISVRDTHKPSGPARGAAKRALSRQASRLRETRASSRQLIAQG
jgi:hypothetical protein